MLKESFLSSFMNTWFVSVKVFCVEMSDQAIASTTNTFLMHVNNSR